MRALIRHGGGIMAVGFGVLLWATVLAAQTAPAPGRTGARPPARGGAMPASGTAPIVVVPDTVEIRISVPDSLPQPLAVHVVQDTLAFGGLLHLVLELPDAATERRILDLVEAEQQGPGNSPVCIALEDVLNARQEAMAVHLSSPLRDYIVRLVTATRAAPFLDEIDHAISPRGSLALAAASKARAWLEGRDHALPEDVQAVAEDALAHRIVMAWRATAEGRNARALIADVLDAVAPL